MTAGDCCNGSCVNGVCGACLPDGMMCGANGDCCVGQCNNGICGLPNPCTHDVCVTGPPLAPGCSPCAAAVCQVDAFCCQGQWDALCVSEVPNACGQTCGMCSPDGAACSFAAQCCSNACNGGICGGCAPDGASCVDSAQCCSSLCTAGKCAPACAPDGAACMVAGDCCTGQCNGGICGGPPPCKPNGTDCASSMECCSNDCNPNNNKCTGCKPDGQACMTAGECCSNECNGGLCGPPTPVCPSDGSVCGDCIADNCCDQIAGCFASPQFIDDVTCFVGCISGGGGPGQCFFQCISGPQALGVVVCLGTNCGPGVCF